MSKIFLEQKPAQQQTLLATLAMQQAFHVLMLPILELGPWLENEIAANPLLEKTEDVHRSFPQFEEIEQPHSLYEHLHWQVQVSDFDEKQRDLAEQIIGNLDERGFFPDSLPKQREVLKKIQLLDPVGIAARDLQDSLLIQLEAKGLISTKVYRLIQEEFDSLSKVDPETKKILSGLNFAPAAPFSRGEIRPISADVIVQQEGDQFKITINEEGIPDFTFSPLYEKVLKTDADQRYMRQKIAAGKWLLRILSRRGHILEQITESLIESSPAYFRGKDSPAPSLTIKEVAEKLSLNPSTIARAIVEKHLLCANGLIPLKTFFPRKLSEKTLSAKEILKSLIAKENHQKPLSDELLAEMIHKYGVPCARRTVAKYRKQMGIPSARRRLS